MDAQPEEEDEVAEEAEEGDKVVDAIWRKNSKEAVIPVIGLETMKSSSSSSSRDET